MTSFMDDHKDPEKSNRTIFICNDICISYNRRLPSNLFLVVFCENSEGISFRLKLCWNFLLRNQFDVTSMLKVGLDDGQLRLHRELTERAKGPVVVDGLLKPGKDSFPCWFVLISGFRSRRLLFFVVFCKKLKNEIFQYWPQT